MDQITLKLDPYSATNLRWVLAEILNGTKHQDLNTGDWNGEVLFDLEYLMEEAGPEFVNYWPNGQPEEEPTYSFLSWDSKPDRQQ